MCLPLPCHLPSRKLTIVPLPASISTCSEPNNQYTLTDILLLNTSTTALSPGAFLVRSLSSASTIPKSFPVSCTRIVTSAQYPKAVPSEGLIAVAENVDRGLVGTLDETELVNWIHQRSAINGLND